MSNILLAHDDTQTRSCGGVLSSEDSIGGISRFHGFIKYVFKISRCEETILSSELAVYDGGDR